MKKLILVVSIFFISCFVYQDAHTQTTAQRFKILQNEVRSYIGDIDILVKFHEDGISESFTTTRGNIFTLSKNPTAGEKSIIRIEIAASLDSIIVKAGEMKALLP